MNIRLADLPDCVKDPSCVAMTQEMDVLFSTGRYDYPAAILLLEDMDAYLEQHRTARKRAQHARNLGYTFGRFDRSTREEDIYRINTSMPERQGRPMGESYRVRQRFTPLPNYPCPRHRVTSYGVFTSRDRLVAYMVMYVSGEMAMVSQILGHGDFMGDDVMYLLAVESFRQLPLPVCVFYNRWDSGQDGLRYFKARLGFRPERVAWAA